MSYGSSVIVSWIASKILNITSLGWSVTFSSHKYLVAKLSKDDKRLIMIIDDDGIYLEAICSFELGKTKCIGSGRSKYVFSDDVMLLNLLHAIEDRKKYLDAHPDEVSTDVAETSLRYFIK